MPMNQIVSLKKIFLHIFFSLNFFREVNFMKIQLLQTQTNFSVGKYLVPLRH